MKLIRRWTNRPDQPLTSPFPTRNGVLLSVYSGDVLEPIGIGTNWFKPPYPKHVWRWSCPWPILPFISYRFGKRAGYLGFKCFGVDAPEYGEWLCSPAEVYEGSLAACITIRPFATLKEQA